MTEHLFADCPEAFSYGQISSGYSGYEFLLQELRDVVPIVDVECWLL